MKAIHLLVLIWMFTISGWSEEKTTCTYSPELAKRAEAGDADAQFDVARCYLGGKGVARDEKEAVKWYRKAAGRGDAYGEFLLGVAYECGVGVKRDYERAVEMYQKSAERGSVYGQCFLGSCYEEGFGVEKNEVLAKMWYAAARKNDPKKTAEILKGLRSQM
jgi:TPR repeat protein